MFPEDDSGHLPLPSRSDLLPYVFPVNDLADSSLVESHGHLTELDLHPVDLLLGKFLKKFVPVQPSGLHSLEQLQGRGVDRDARLSVGSNANLMVIMVLLVTGSQLEVSALPLRGASPHSLD